MGVILLAVLGAGVLVFAPLLYVGWRLDRAPTLSPEDVLATGRPDGPLLLCLGDSITHGHIGADWVGQVRERRGPDGLTVVNGGVNGELVWNVRQRAAEAVSLRPDLTVLMIGTNDVMAADLPERARSYRRSNRLPRIPDLDWSIAELTALVAEVRGAGGQTALCTIPPLGDDPTAPGETLVRQFNVAVRDVAEATGVPLIDIHASLTGLTAKGGRAYSGGLWSTAGLILQATIRRYLLGQSWDAIAKAGGWNVTVDGIHLSDRAGAIVAREIGAWTDASADKP